MLPDLLIALAAIAGPESTDLPACSLHSLQKVAVSMELLDPRECRYWFVNSEQLAYDLKEIRARFSEIGDAPPLCDAERFSSAEHCQAMKAWNRECKAWLEQRALLFPAERWIPEAIEECEQLWRVWGWAKDVQSDCYIYWRRRCMKNLREAIGPLHYYAGCLPAPIPAWRIRRVD